MAQPTPQLDILFAGRYRLLENIGVGAQSTVWAALDTRVRRTVAIKIANPMAPGSSARIRREAEVLSKLHHPNIVTYLECGEVDGSEFVSLELLKGESLRSHLRRNGPPDHSQAFKWAFELCAAISHVHDCGYLHRDLKPENVIVLDVQSLVLIDFGLSSMIDSDHILTGLSQSPGTEGYIDRASVGQDNDERRDIFAFGVILGELFGVDLSDQTQDRWVRMPSEVYNVVKRCKAPVEERFYRIEQVEDALRRATPPERSRKILWHSTALLIAVAVLSLATFSLVNSWGAHGSNGGLATSALAAQHCENSLRLIEARDYHHARQSLDRGLKSGVQVASCLLSSVELDLASYARSGQALDLKHAEESVQVLHAAFSGTCESELARGLIEIGKGKLAEARKTLEPLASQWSDRTDVLGALASLEYYEGRWEKGLRHVVRLIELRPDLTKNRMMQALFLRKLNRLPEAEVTYHDILAHSPSDEGALLNLGSLVLQRGKFPEAVGYFDQARLVSDSVEAHIGITQSYLYSGQCRSAELSAARGIDVIPQSDVLHGLLGEALLCQGKTDSSVEHFVRALTLGEQVRTSGSRVNLLHLRMSRYAARLRDYQGARAYINVARISGDPKERVLYAEAVLALLQGHASEALVLRQQAIATGYSRMMAEGDPVWIVANRSPVSGKSRLRR